MDRRYFLSLYGEEERKHIEEDLELGAEMAIISCLPVVFRGSLPASDSLLLASCGFSDLTGEEMYISSLEASLSGIEIISEADAAGQLSVLKGAEDGEGRLHVVTSASLSSYISSYPQRASRILLTGGSIISTGMEKRNTRAAWSLSAFLSSHAFVAMMGYGWKEVLSMLDDGKDIAITRTSLTTHIGRTLALEGCPVASSYSSAFPFRTGCIVYPSPEGQFSFLDKRFDYLRLY